MIPVSRNPFPKPRRLYGKQRTPKNDLEAAVLKECKAYLQTNSCVLYVERRNTGAVAFDDGSRVSFGSLGAADLWILARSPLNPANPRHIEIECKRRDGKGKLSESQEAFAEDMKAIGIIYLVVQSAEELRKKLESFGFMD